MFWIPLPRLWWPQSSAWTYFPGLCKLLAEIPVVSAQANFAPLGCAMDAQEHYWDPLGMTGAEGAGCDTESLPTFVPLPNFSSALNQGRKSTAPQRRDMTKKSCPNLGRQLTL